MSTLLFGKTTESPRHAHFYFSGFNLQAVRQGPWKLAVTPQGEHMGTPPPEDASGPEPRLYHLENDIAERVNVAAENPEVVSRLKALADTIKKEIGGKNPPGRRPAGTVKEPVMLYPAKAGKPARKGTRPNK